MRLTEKDGSYKEYVGDGNAITGIREWNNSLTQKLGQLEDIEDELGIDLVTLFKALKDGYYIKGCDDEIYHVSRDNEFVREIYADYRSIIYIDIEDDTYGYDFKKYGEYWALTREELE